MGVCVILCNCKKKKQSSGGIWAILACKTVRLDEEFERKLIGQSNDRLVWVIWSVK